MILGWVKARRSRRHAAELIAASDKAINRLGALIEQYPTAYIDETLLPLSKPQMKLCLRVALATTKDESQKDKLFTGWVFLANFQPGVGQVPLECPMPDGRPTSEDIERMDRWLEIGKAVVEESQQNLLEAREFSPRDSV